MEKATIIKINKGIQKSFRKSLNEIQLSADDRTIVKRNMISPDDKTLLKQSKSAAKVIVAEKENAPAVRRSKRKTAVEKVTYAESPLELKPPKSKNTQAKKTVTKSKKSRSVLKKNEQKIASSQTKLNFSPSRTEPVKENIFVPNSSNTEKCAPTAAIVTDDDSGFDPTCGISDHSPMNSTTILRTPQNTATVLNDISVITADIPPLSYWKELAEQRRIALEKALHQNELLHDELTVLEAENSQLKQLVKEAENLAQVLRAIVD